MTSLSVTADQTAALYIVPIDLSSIFTGYKFSAAVTSTHNRGGAWDAAGQTRPVHLADDSSARELLTDYEHPEYLYTVSDLTGALRFFTNSADGEWWSRPASASQTLKWRYEFNPRTTVAVPVLWFITTFLRRNYMRKALELSKVQKRAAS